MDDYYYVAAQKQWYFPFIFRLANGEWMDIVEKDGRPTSI